MEVTNDVQDTEPLELVKPNVASPSVSSQDFQCPLCCEVFLEPTTISCGHTFCMECLQRVFDGSSNGLSQCPMCRHQLYDVGKQALNVTLNDIIKKYLPEALEARLSERVRMSDSCGWVPLFILGIVVFPKEVIKLHVFEPRYRLMVRRCLSGSGKFGILFSGNSIGTIVSIKRTTPLPDGRFLLSVVGRTRFRVCCGFGSFWGILEEILESANVDGYQVAKYEELEDTTEPELIPLVEQIKTNITGMSHVAISNYCEDIQLNDPYDFSMGVAAVIPISWKAKQKLLEMVSTKERLETERLHLAQHKTPLTGGVSSWLLFFGLIAIIFAQSFSHVPY